MKVLFWGTPSYAVPTLDALVDAGHQVVGVVSQPDRRRGRGSALHASPVKARALTMDLPVFTPHRIRRDPECQRRLARLGADAHVVVAFGQILPLEVLQQPPLGCWNGHGSLLPRWRGAAPIQWALIEGDPETGVGIMAMEEGLDTGPVLLERRLRIGLLENARRLEERLSRLTADLFVEALPLIEAAGRGSEQERLRRLGVRPQSDIGTTYARLLQKEDYRIDWNLPALAIHRRVMGLYPGAMTGCRGRRLKLLATEPLLPSCSDELSPEAVALMEGRPARDAAAGTSGTRSAGTVLAGGEGVGLPISCGDSQSLLIRVAQLEGRSPLEGDRLRQQLALQPGDQLG